MVPRLSALTRTLALGLVLLLLAGCLQVKAGLEVNPDDTVSGQLTVFATKQELGQDKVAGFANYRQQLPPLPEGREAPFEDATNYGVIITYDHTPLAKFNGNIKVVRTGNQIVFTIGLDPAVIAGQVPNGNASSTGTYLTLTGFEITVTLPGNIVSAQTNGTVIGQNNVAWNLAPNTAKPAELKAVSVVSGGTAPSASASTSATPVAAGGGSSHTLVWVLLAVGIVVLLAAGALAFLLLRRRRPAAATPAPTPGPGPNPAAG